MMRLLSLLFRHSPGLVMLAVVGGAVSGLSNAALLAVMNAALHRRDPYASPGLVWTFVGLCLVVPIARAGSSYLLTVLGQRRVLDLRHRLSAAMLQAPLRVLEDLGTPKLLAALTSDVATIVIAVSSLPSVFVQGAIVAGCLAYLGWLSPMALGMVTVILGIGIVSYQLPVLRAQRYQRQGREEADRLYGHFRAITGGAKELKLHAPRQQALLAELDATGLRVRRFTVVSTTIFSAAAGWGQLVVFGLIGAIVFIVPAVQQVRPTTLTGYALVLLFMMGPLQAMLDVVPTVGRAKVSFDKLEALGFSLDGEAAKASPAPLPPPAGRWESVALVGVTHRYYREGDDDHFTMGPIDLALRPGEIVFLVGGNGSGKTTLAKLIVGLYAPEEGEVRLDGRPVTDATRAAYMQHFSFVFSDFFLFDSLLGLDSPGVDGEAARWLERLQLSHKVSVRDGRLSTTALSQGQRKRLALLTAYLEDRPIYVFDEWAADQDPTFKELFYRELLPALRARGKGVLVISHDDHYYGAADRILKLDYGRLEYDGDPGCLYGQPAYDDAGEAHARA